MITSAATAVRSGRQRDRGDGNDAIVTYANGAFLVRTVYGPGENEPLYQIDNQGRRTWFAQDERGSTVAGSNAAGTAGAAIAHDEDA